MSRKIILIGGMPTAGKSTIAKQVAQRTNLPCISTDQIRLIMQSVASPDKYPALFNSSGYSAEEFLERYSAEEIATMEYEQAREVWVGIKHFIENDWIWKDGCVIEGVSILPSMIDDIRSESRDVSVIFLSDLDHIRTKNVVYSRGLFDDARSYGDHVKDKEVEWVKLFDSMIRRDAKAHNFPAVDMLKNSSDIERVMQHIS